MLKSHISHLECVRAVLYVQVSLFWPDELRINEQKAKHSHLVTPSLISKSTIVLPTARYYVLSSDEDTSSDVLLSSAVWSFYVGEFSPLDCVLFIAWFHIHFGAWIQSADRVPLFLGHAVQIFMRRLYHAEFVSCIIEKNSDLSTHGLKLQYNPRPKICNRFWGGKQKYALKQMLFVNMEVKSEWYKKDFAFQEIFLCECLILSETTNFANVIVTYVY